MRLCVVTAHSPAYTPLADLTEPIKREYCSRHGFDFHTVLYPDKVDYASQTQLSFRFLATGRYDWLMWIGADAMFTNLGLLPAIGIEASFIVCTDAKGINLDVFLARCDEACASFFYDILASRPAYQNAPCLEQDAMEMLLPRYRSRIHFLPQWEMNAYEYPLYAFLGHPYTTAQDKFGNRGQWQPGDFVLHVPGLPLEQRIKVIQDHLPLIQR